MNIYYCTPFSQDKNLGKAYNEYVRKLATNQDDYIFFIDGDVQILDSNWGNHVKDLINKYPETGIFTALTNRCGNLKQCHLGIRNQSENILGQYELAQVIKKNNYWQVTEINRVISGYFFGFSIKTFDLVGGFSENEGEILKVDNRFSKKVLEAGKKILLMCGVYVFHYYRLHEADPKHSIQHLL